MNNDHKYITIHILHLRNKYLKTGNLNAQAVYDNLVINTLHIERDIDTYMQISHNYIKYPLSFDSENLDESHLYVAPSFH